MFADRFSLASREALEAAQAETVRFGQSYIGTEHLLLGLIKTGQPQQLIDTLNEQNQGLESARKALAGLVGAPPRKVDPVSGPLPFTPRAKRVLEVALREALSAGDQMVEPERMVLALLQEQDGVAAQILHQMEISLQTLWVRVMPTPPMAATAATQPPDTSALFAAFAAVDTIGDHLQELYRWAVIGLQLDQEIAEHLSSNSRPRQADQRLYQARLDALAGEEGS